MAVTKKVKNLNVKTLRESVTDHELALLFSSVRDGSFDVCSETKKVFSDLDRYHGFSKESIKRVLLDCSENSEFAPMKQPLFTFIDLFAGIGGFRLALQSLGGRCTFSSEIDKYARTTYLENFGSMPFGDITEPKGDDRPDIKKYLPNSFNILCAGFPCQAFSIAGRKLGFEDARGTLFFEIASVLEKSRPDAFFLENVKGLQNHKGGKTIARLLEILENELNYFVVKPEIINARNFGLAQNRERIFIVGFKKEPDKAFTYPESLTTTAAVFEDVREKHPVEAKYYLSQRYLSTLRKHKNRHRDRGNGFGYQVVEDDGVANAIVVGGMGRERNLVRDFRQKDLRPTTNIKGPVNSEGIRRMTPREWARLQGFPDEFTFPVSDAQAYKQLGNSVAVTAIEATARQILISLGILSSEK